MVHMGRQLRRLREHLFDQTEAGAGLLRGRNDLSNPLSIQ
jgi:hypothetical protein